VAVEIYIRQIQILTSFITSLLFSFIAGKAVAVELCVDVPGGQDD